MSLRPPSPIGDSPVPDGSELNGEDPNIEELLREVGARVEPNESLAHVVRESVHAEWLAAVQRHARRRTLRIALAAGVVGLVAATVTLRVRQPAPAPEWVADVVKAEGQIQVEVTGGFHQLRTGERLQAGTRLQSDNGQAAVALGNTRAISLRIGANSQLLFKTPDVIELSAGAVYVDASTDGPHMPLTVHTTAGAVRHVGTQYQVRTVDTRSLHGVEISIREGRVEIASRFGSNTGLAGERVAVSDSGSITRSALLPYDSSWMWAERLAPPFDIDGSSLNAFLEWAAHETGRTLNYDNSDTRRAAAALELRGSVAGLDPNQAIYAVLSGTRFQQLESNKGSLAVALKHD